MTPDKAKSDMPEIGPNFREQITLNQNQMAQRIDRVEEEQRNEKHKRELGAVKRAARTRKLAESIQQLADNVSKLVANIEQNMATKKDLVNLEARIATYEQNYVKKEEFTPVQNFFNTAQGAAKWIVVFFALGIITALSALVINPNLVPWK